MPGWLETSGVVGEWVELGKGDLAAIPADKFGAAATTLIGVFDLISGMGMAKGDMDKNANTVKAAAEANSGKTLQELIDAECAGKTPKEIKKIAGDGKTTTCALLWLVRALYFILKLLEPLVSQPDLKLGECVGKGYEVSLKPHHGMMIKGTFSVALKAAPKRETFIAQLAESQEEAFKQINEVTPVVSKMLESLNSKLIATDADSLTAYK